MESDNVEVGLETLDLLPCKELKSALKRRGLSTAGNKNTLIECLRSDQESQENKPALGLCAMKSDESSEIISIRRKEKCLKININHIV